MRGRIGHDVTHGHLFSSHHSFRITGKSLHPAIAYRADTNCAGDADVPCCVASNSGGGCGGRRNRAARRCLAGAELRLIGVRRFRIASPLLWQSVAFYALLGATILLAHWGAMRESPMWRRSAWTCLILCAVVAV